MIRVILLVYLSVFLLICIVALLLGNFYWTYKPPETLEKYIQAIYHKDAAKHTLELCGEIEPYTDAVVGLRSKDEVVVDTRAYELANEQYTYGIINLTDKSLPIERWMLSADSQSVSVLLEGKWYRVPFKQPEILDYGPSQLTIPVNSGLARYVLLMTGENSDLYIPSGHYRIEVCINGKYLTEEFELIKYRHGFYTRYKCKGL